MSLYGNLKKWNKIFVSSLDTFDVLKNFTFMGVWTYIFEHIVSMTFLRPSYDLYIRDPVCEDDDSDDFLKTPEGGKEQLDWAAELEAERWVGLLLDWALVL